MLYQLSYSCVVGVVGFEPTQPKHLIYSQARLSNCGAPPRDHTCLLPHPTGGEPMEGLEPPTG